MKASSWVSVDSEARGLLPSQQSSLLAPEVIETWREGEITSDALTAFSRNQWSDKDRQVKTSTLTHSTVGDNFIKSKIPIDAAINRNPYKLDGFRKCQITLWRKN